MAESPAGKASGASRSGAASEELNGHDELRARGELRRKMRRRRRAKRIAAAALVLILLGALAWVIFGSSALNVRDVEVAGQQILTAEQISQKAEVPLGGPLARAPLKQVRERVEQIPAVGEAKVSRNWPHTVRIEVTERQARFQIQDAAGWHWVDDQGVVFHVTADAQPIPPVSADQADQQMLRGVAELIVALPDQLRAQIGSIDATKANRMTISLADGRLVIWGNANLANEKATVLVALLNQPGKIYDVSSPSHPAVSG